jgi:hypothetical protein
MGVGMWIGREGFLYISTNDLGSFKEGQRRTGAILSIQSVKWTKSSVRSSSVDQLVHSAETPFLLTKDLG